MRIIRLEVALLILSWLVVVVSCQNKKLNNTAEVVETEEVERDFEKALRKHLEAVSNRDLATLKSTMSPEGNMQLILPGSEMITSVDSFINYHVEWFKDTAWTFETKIMSTEVGNRIGIAVVEALYQEPERNGRPYFNRMIVSYGLERHSDTWYIIKDHASSVKKSTDGEQ